MRLPRRDPDRYRPTPRRTLALIAVLAAVTAAAVMLAVLDAGGRAERARRAPPEPPRCAQGQLDGCVGGRLAVQVVPAAAASAPP